MKKVRLQFSASDYNVRRALEKPHICHRPILACASRSSFVTRSGGGSLGLSLTQCD